MRTTVALNREEINAIIHNAALASSSLQQGLTEIRASPWRLFYKPSEAEAKEFHLFNTARRFAEASAHLDRATTRLSSYVATHPERATPDDAEFGRLRAALKAHMERFAEAEQALLVELNVK